MKIAIGLTCLFLACVPSASAGGGAQIALKGGLNLAEVELGTSPDETTTYDQRTGYGGGFELDIPASPALCFEFDLLYMQKGSTAQAVYRDGLRPESENVYFDYDTRLDYLVLAPMLRFTARDAGFSPYLQLGGEFGYLLGATSHMESHREGSSGGPAVETDIEEYFERTDFGVCFGGGFELPLRNYAFFLEGRYSLGLSDIGKEIEGHTLEQKNRGIYIFGGLRF